MKPLLLAATAAAFTTAVNLSPASAAERNAAGANAPSAMSQAIGNRAPDAAPEAAHYEWQYRYVGRHPRYEGHWVLVQ